MAKHNYSPDSGQNSHNSVSMTGTDFHVPGGTMSTAIGTPAPEPGGALTTKAKPSTVVNSIN